MNCARLAAIYLLSFVFPLLNSYMVIINEHDELGKIVFNASVYKLGSERHYKINAHKSAHFVHHLLNIDAITGEIRLRKSVRCDGIHYPSLFTFYVDSSSSRLHSIDYYSMPLRIFIVGKKCVDLAKAQNFRRIFVEDYDKAAVHVKRLIRTEGHLFQDTLLLVATLNPSFQWIL